METGAGEAAAGLVRGAETAAGRPEVPCCRGRPGGAAAGAAGAAGGEGGAGGGAAALELTRVLSSAGTRASPGCQRTSFAVAAAVVVAVVVVVAAVVPTVQVQHLIQLFLIHCQFD